MKVFRAVLNFKEPLTLDAIAKDIDEAMDIILDHLIKNGNEVSYDIFLSIGMLSEPINLEEIPDPDALENKTVEPATDV